jgi:mannose-6-phosphate isomerase
MEESAGPLGPIQLRACLHETLWGGRNLAALAGKVLPPEASIGESWETELRNVACNQPYAGRTLEALSAVFGERLYGSRARQVYGPRFPLLAKFIDAQQQLSVQVHPDDIYAAAHEDGKLGKTEVWYILHAQPGGSIVYGMRRPTDSDEVRSAIAAHRLEELLHVLPVTAGDVIFVPAGTVHAIGAGVVLYELQEYSDITYRLYDYGRLQADGTPRTLHVEQALAVMDYTPPTMTKARPVDHSSASGRVLAACRYFVLEEQRLHGPLIGRSDGASCEIVTMLQGRLSVTGPGGSCVLGLGETAVLPAAMGECRLQGEHARFARSYVPHADAAALSAWTSAQSAGVP